MEIRQCGHSGLRVSALGLGALTWGRDTDPGEAIAMMSHFVDAGGTLINVSPLDGDGQAIDVVAQGLQALGRHRVVLALRGASRPGGTARWVPTGARGDMLRSLDDALARLGVDNVDLWLADFDPSVPLSETLSALEAAHSSGRARYIGLTGFGLWDAARAITLLDEVRGIHPAVVQLPYSLLSAPHSADLVSKAREYGVGVIATSPLAGGVLTGKYRHSTPADSRAASPHLRELVDSYLDGTSRSIVEGVARAAEGLERSILDVALTWARDAAGISSALVGPRTARQLEQILEGCDPIPVPIRNVLNEIAGL